MANESKKPLTKAQFETAKGIAQAAGTRLVFVRGGAATPAGKSSKTPYKPEAWEKMQAKAQAAGGRFVLVDVAGGGSRSRSKLGSGRGKYVRTAKKTGSARAGTWGNPMVVIVKETAKPSRGKKATGPTPGGYAPKKGPRAGVPFRFGPKKGGGVVQQAKAGLNAVAEQVGGLVKGG